jgi:hypothetical protein
LSRRSRSRLRAPDLDRAGRAGRRPRRCSVAKRATIWVRRPPLSATPPGQPRSRERPSRDGPFPQQ